MSTIETITKQLQLLFNENDYAAAKQILVEASKQITLLPEERGRVYHLLGRIEYYEGDFHAARRSFVAALGENVRDYYAKLFLARVEEKLGEKDSALKLYANVLEERPHLTQLAEHLTGLLGGMDWSNAELGKLILQLKGDSPAASTPYPKMSILVLCYNKVEYTERCLQALFKNTDYPNFEVIVVDNASVDDTPGLLETYARKVTFVHSPTNLGFVGGNNLAAQSASGECIVFLNNDTEPHPHWLTEVYNCFVLNPSAGAVGSMLVYPNGVLQEAGGAVFSDASGWNYGRGDSQISSRFRFSREVDYCSGAALTIRTEIFEKLGGFDTRYAPAYYEDSDLCFSVRKLGYKVMYCSSSIVTHHEGITAGTDLNSGYKKYQVLNEPKFKEKWSKELQTQYPNDPSLCYQFSNRNRGKRVLIIDDWPPLPDKASGTLRMYNTLKQMIGLGWNITYVHLVAKNIGETGVKHLNELRALGVEFIWFEYEVWWEQRNSPGIKGTLEKLINSLELQKRKPDVVYLSFWHVADYFMDHIRTIVPATPIIVDTHDLHYLRETRQAELLKDDALRANAKKNKKRELETYAKADCVTTVTERDREILQKDLPNKAIFIMTNVHDPVRTVNGFEARKDFLFVGNFNHAPNEDAVEFFVEEIFPLIRKDVPQVRFLIVGNNPTPKVKALAADDVIVTGWVPEIKPYLENCRVSVVPLRYGAGVKGKVGETLAHGLPTVLTTIGAEGMNIVNEHHAFVADDPRQFAEYAVRLYNDKETWEKFSKGGKTLVKNQYSSEATRKRLEYLMSFERRESYRSYRALKYPTPPRASIIILAHNQFSFTRQCLDSIRSYSGISHETIVVDNASTDATAKGIEQGFPEVRLIKNATNLGFPAAVNQGLNASLGEYIVLLNNDTVLTEGWLERLIEVAESDPSIGIVGPVSNYVSGVQIDRNVKYENMDEMHIYATKVAQENKGQIMFFPCVAFLCTLIKRKVIDTIGGLDERFSPGNFEDDDFCLRSTIAGFKTAIAKDVFIHHYGSKSFRAHGAEQYNARLRTNAQIFTEKWGVDHEALWTQGREVKKRSLKIPLSPDAFVQHFEQAQILLEEKEVTLAMAALERALTTYHVSPRNNVAVEYPLVLDLAANVALMLGQLEKARQYFQEELTLVPNSTSACAGLGEVFSLAEMDQAAKTMFEHAIVNDKENLAAKRGLAKVNKALGLPEEDNVALGTVATGPFVGERLLLEWDEVNL